VEAHHNVWIEKNKSVVLSNWRVQLLKAADKSGSLAQAAKVMKVSDRTARHKLREMETALGYPLLEAGAGEGRQKSLHLTARGRKLVDQFAVFSDGLEQEVAQRYKAAFR